MIFGKIDYINLLPFHIFLKQSSLNSAFKKGVEYKKGVPSAINREFNRRRVSAAFISSIKSDKKSIKQLPLGIVAKKSVKSVIVKRGECGFDPASATSNILSKILGIQGEVMIGDRALKAYIEDSSQYVDLAQVWHERYRLPFVFAVLCVNEHYGLYKRLAKSFRKRDLKIPRYILQDYAKKRGIDAKEIREYLKLITYKIEKREKMALKLFIKKGKALDRKSNLHKMNMQK